MRAVRAADARQPLADVGDGGVPRCLLEELALAHERMVDAIGALVQIAEARSLGAGEAARDDVIGIGAQGAELVAFDICEKTAGGFADAAVGDACLHQAGPSTRGLFVPAGE